MMRAACILLLFASAPLRAADTSMRLDQVRLFDWYYPAEPAYLALREAALAAGRRGWLVERMAAGRNLPQASARELALELLADPRLPGPSRKALQEHFRPERDQVAAASPDISPDVATLEEAFAGLNKRLGEMETTIKANHYNKQSYPGASLSTRSNYVNVGAAGLLQGSNDSYFQGSVGINFNGQSNGGGFSFGVSQGYGKGDPLDFPGKRGSYTYGNPSFEIGWGSATFAASLGQGHTLKRSALVLGTSAAPGAVNNFVLRLEDDPQPANQNPELAVGLPYGGGWLDLLMYMRKQGSEKYWPFQDFEAFYGPEPQFVESWNTKRFVWGVHGDSNLGTLFGLLDNELLGITFVGASNDRNVLKSYNVGDNPQGNFAWAVTSESLGGWGGQLFLEYGQASTYAFNSGYTFQQPSLIQGYTSGTLKGFERRIFDDGLVACYLQPVSVFTFGLEYSHIGPKYFPALGAVAPSVIFGTDHSPLAVGSNPANQGDIYPWAGAPYPSGRIENNRTIVDTDRDLAYISDISTATGLMANSDKVVLQMQTAWSWISMGVFHGMASQLNPSGPWIKTRPHFESSGDQLLLYGRFGGTYYQPTPPKPVGTAPSPTNSDGTANESYYQWLYNNPGDATAKAGSLSFPAHWNALEQRAYKQLDLHYLVSEKGVGDQNLEMSSRKYINYMAASLKFDIQSLLGRLLPFEINLFGETRDLSPKTGLPSFGAPGAPGSQDMLYFTQTYGTLFWRYGLTKNLTFLGIAGYEEWRSNHSYFPIFQVMSQYGVGLNMDANELLTGLGLYVRSRIVYMDDLFIAGRTLNAWETSLGSSLNF